MSINAYGILFPPYVSMVVADSQQGFGTDSPGVAFGVVDAINYNGQMALVGTHCIFDKTEAIILSRGPETFYLVKEKDLIFKESEILPP